MKYRYHRIGFTAVELISVIVAIGALFSTLFPTLFNTPKTRATQCMSNLRQLTIAALMYAQEHDEAMPGADWAKEMRSDFRDTDILICSEAKGNVAAQGEDAPVNYGYNGMLVKTNGKGMELGDISGDPTNMLMLSDAAPVKTIKAPGVIGGTFGRTDNVVEVAYRHTGKAIMGFLDGHVESSAAEPDRRDYRIRVNHAYANRLVLDNIPNYGSCLTTPVEVADPLGPCMVGGDFCTIPVLRAVADVLNRKLADGHENSITYGTFAGELADEYRTGAVAEATIVDSRVICGIGSDVPSPGMVAIARDAVVVIKNRSNKNVVPANMTSEEVRTYWAKPTGQTITYGPASGTRAFFYQKIGLTTTFDDSKATQVENEYAMVRMVANDPEAIGYCSAAFVDPEQVEIIAVDGISFPNPDPKANNADKYLWPTAAPITAYPYMRTLYAGASAEATEGAKDFMAKLPAVLKAVQSGPLFRTSYFLP